MKVIVNNEKIKGFISFHGYTKEQFAKLCHIKRKQVDTLLTKKKINIALSTALNITAGTELKPEDLFLSIEQFSKSETAFMRLFSHMLKFDKKHD